MQTQRLEIQQFLSALESSPFPRPDRERSLARSGCFAPDAEAISEADHLQPAASGDHSRFRKMAPLPRRQPRDIAGFRTFPSALL